MTGVLNAMVASGTVERRSVTVGVDGGAPQEAGYVQGVYGSIDNAALRSVTLTTIWSTTNSDLWLDADQSVAQSFFLRLRVQDGGGSIRSYESSAATFSHPTGASTRWTWGDGSSRVWEIADDSEVKSLEFVF